VGDVGRSSPNVVWHPGHLSQEQRWAAIGHTGATVWFTGLSGSGKSTVATAVEKALLDRGRPCYVLDGDNVRMGLNGDLGFSAADRDENVRRVAEVGRLLADAGVVALVPLVSPYPTVPRATTPERCMTRPECRSTRCSSTPRSSCASNAT
jgi:adenylylsulfate kinase